MIKQVKWIDRKFDFNSDPSIFLNILERFRGTPARLEELLKNVTPEILTKKNNGKWSIQEHVGHLLDLEELGERRIDDFLNGSEILSSADITNSATDELDYNKNNIKDILLNFRNARSSLVSRLEKLGETEVRLTSLHPRLKQKMRIIDWVYFMCEHDDHHLTAVRALLF